MVEEERSEVGTLELRIGNSGAEVEAFRVGDFAEFGDFGGVRAKWKRRGSQSAEGQLNEITTSHG